uniref:G_PROTEIN_RECEP_F1_2 domain-containing protein n=1 Tax=Rhabditophanes sp. KR3021 TaxID=114890 RepID=A0AC35UEQ2_9BILA
LGISLNVFLLFLIWKFSPVEHKRYRILLSFNVCSSMLVTISLLPNYLVLDICDGNYIVHQFNLLKYTDNFFIHRISFTFFIFALFSCIFSSSSMFIFRYFQICTTKKIQIIDIQLMFFIGMVCAFVIAGLFYFVMSHDYRNDGDMLLYVLKNGIATEDTINKIFLLMFIIKTYKNPFFLTCLLTITIFFGANYTIILFCIFKVNKYLESHSSNYDKVTKRLHSELTRLMIIQLLLPFIFTSGQMLFCIVSMIFELKTTGVGIIDMIMISFLPSVNAFCFLINSKSYWANMFKIKNKKIVVTRSKTQNRNFKVAVTRI